MGLALDTAPSTALKIATAEHTRRQIIWDRHLQNGMEPRRNYKKTAVNELGRVFKDQYGFDVEKKLIKSTANSQWDLTAHLATFFHEYDSKSNLLIIYYAGHGWAPPSLHKEKSNAATSKANCVKWHEAENMLAYVKADVLAIFDCCNAGRLCHTRGPALWEVLGACSEDQRTQPPGPDSFTKALIWALEALRKEPKCRFSTAELQRMIKEAPDLPRSQQPPLANRTNDTLPHIIITPYIKENETDDGLTISPPEDEPVKVSQHFDIRFHADEISDGLIEETAIKLNKLISRDSDSYLEVERISYLGSDSVRWALVQHVGKYWLRSVRRPKTPVKESEQVRETVEQLTGGITIERPKLQISLSVSASSTRDQVSSATSDKSMGSDATTCVGEIGQTDGKESSSSPARFARSAGGDRTNGVQVTSSLGPNITVNLKNSTSDGGRKRPISKVEEASSNLPGRETKLLRKKHRD
ncbi:ATP-dependent RNA helicase [Venturia nashicola]|nr:ATP-dependent RNA helicase [Venturia nashicola]